MSQRIKPDQPPPKAAKTKKQPQIPAGTEALTAALDRAAPLLETALEPHGPLSSRLSDLRERLTHNRLQLAVLGQFKRGKSTFVNALLGAPLLPAAVVPLTAAATFIAWGEKPLIRIQFQDRRPPETLRDRPAEEMSEFLFRYVAEEANPHNHLGIAKAELFYPAPILQGGTVLIDTPGVGSTLTHNTDTAMEVLPECDAALFVIATDPPITAVELDYLERLRTKMSRIFIVLNKIDTVAPDERQALSAFVGKVLRERGLLPDEPALFEVSARAGLAAKLAGDSKALAASGIADIEQRLLHYLATEKTQSLVQAIGIKTVDLLHQAVTEIELRMQALAMPLAALEDRTARFESALRRIEEQRRVVADLMAGKKRRLIERLEEDVTALKQKTMQHLTKAIDDSLAGDDPAQWETKARQAVSAAMEKSFQGTRQDMAKDCASEADEVLAKDRARIDELVSDVRRNAAELFDIAFREDIGEDNFAIRREPYWVTEDIAANLIPDPGKLLDRMLPASFKRPRLRARLLHSTQELVIRNAENLRWALLRGFDETFRSAAGHFEERLDDAIGATRSVIAQALSDRRDKSFAAKPEIERLRALREALQDVETDIGPLLDRRAATH